MCIPTPGLNIAVCDNANYMPSFSGIAGAGNCAGIGPFSDCSCVQKTDCGGSGQAPCSIGDPVIKGAIKAALSTGALSSGVAGYNLIAPLIEKIMSVDTACRDSSLQSYSTSRGKLWLHHKLKLMH
jgi:hypothetical protein